MKLSRKKELKDIRARLIELNAYIISEMEEIQSQLEDVNSALEEQFDNLSEASQENEVGEKVQDDISDLEYIISDASDIASCDPEDCNEFDLGAIIQGIDDLLEK